jgi:hypothetical protein
VQGIEPLASPFTDPVSHRQTASNEQVAVYLARRRIP